MKNYFLILFILLFQLVSAQKTALIDWNFHKEKETKITTVAIPHTWNAKDAFDDVPGYWRGKGIYTREINITDSSKVYYLHFNGSNQVTKVWVNDQFVGQHIGGYTAFDLNISKALKQGDNRLKVVVDNAHDTAVPPLDADFTFYGGMYRMVYLMAENPVHFAKNWGTDAIKIDASIDGDSGTLSVETGIANPHHNKIQLETELLDATGKLVFRKAEKVKDTFALKTMVKNLRKWSPDDPYLYQLHIKLADSDGKLLDHYEHKVGFRAISASAKGFKINGMSLKLIGVNRHQDWQGLGNAVPIKKQLQDMDSIKAMGSNILRLAHYPQDPAIYRAADSLGIILWSEIPLVNRVPKDSLAYASYSHNAINMQRESIAQHYNNPSWVFVGYMNEIFLRAGFKKGDEAGNQDIKDRTVSLAKKLEAETRALTPSRITAMAIHQSDVYNETGIADIPMVLGWNLYFGWYGGKISDLGRFLDSEHKKYPDRPLIISEFGVGADNRLHSDHPTKMDFTEEYQLAYNQGYLEMGKARDFVIGMTAWAYADFGSEGRGDAIPHVNQKGLVNYDRSPKNIYYWYKAMLNPKKNLARIYRETPVLINENPKKDIKIITNTDVVLKLNGKEMGTFTPIKGIATAEINLNPGKNTLEVWDTSGKSFDRLEMFWQKPNFKDSKTLAINFGRSDYFTDRSGQVWFPAASMPYLQITGETKTVNSNTNIKNTDEDPLYQSALARIEQIHYKLPEGQYKLTLFFANLGADKTSIYELGKKSNSQTASKGSFDLKINDKPITIEALDTFTKMDKVVTLNVKDELTISAPQSQGFYINGILVEKL